MRKACLDRIHDLARHDERVVFVGSDLSPGLLEGMRREFPDRHYMEGVAEQHIVGMAAGMALDGLIPYVNTIATFITRRCYEQVAVDVCLHPAEQVSVYGAKWPAELPSDGTLPAASIAARS